MVPNPWAQTPASATRLRREQASGDSLNRLAILALNVLSVDEQSERDLNLALERGVVKLVGVGGCHFRFCLSCRREVDVQLED